MTDRTLPDADITGLLQAAHRGDRDALERLLPLIYEELRSLARSQRRRWHGDVTMNATAIVHEAYLKLVGSSGVASESRGHFFAVAAKAVRQVLCNYARDRLRLKRGGDVQHLSLDDALHAIPIELSEEGADELFALDEALRRRERTHPRQSRVVECRFFGGLSIEDTASALGISPATVKRDWALARAWLYREIRRLE